MTVDIRRYFPKYYNGILEVERLIDAENELLNEVKEHIKITEMNQFIRTCDLNTLKTYESILNIIDSNSADIDFRRQRILNRLSNSMPFTINALAIKLNEIIGEGNFKISMDYANYTLYIESRVLDQKWFHETYVTVNKFKPANIVFINRPLLEEKIIINEQISYMQRDYNYKLGTKWRLGQKPFISLNEKGIIKLPQNTSIKEDLITELNRCTASAISYVRLNDSIVINVFKTKEIVDSKVIVEYVVPYNLGLTEINRVDFYDVNDKLLTSANIYVPIIDEVELKHIIKIEEGVN